MTTTTSAESSIEHQLLLLVKKALSDVSVDSLQIVKTIEQASAVGYIVQINRKEPIDETKHDGSYYYFIKRVEAARYLSTKSDWPDMRRTLLYARTEARFYQQFAPQCGPPSLLPKVYMADYQLSEWIPEEEDGFQPADEHMMQLYPQQVPHPQQQHGTLILEYLSDTHYFQDSPLTVSQCHLSLQAVAQLHAAAWQNVKLLQKAATQLSRSSFHLSMRNPKELKNMIAAWDHFAHEFAKELEALSWSRTHLGQRVQAVAQFVSDQLSVTPNSPFATICHGDYKSMNVFLPRNSETTKSAVLVDFASVGIGLGVTDVAMHLHHCLLPTDLDTSEMELVRYYWRTVQDQLAASKTSAYTWDVVWRQYQYAVVDYFRFFLGRFWKSATHASMHKFKDNKNVNLINRSIPAAMAFVVRVDQYLALVEAEYAKVDESILLTHNSI
jgi:thiamine kinase-like enzyme